MEQKFPSPFLPLSLRLLVCTMIDEAALDARLENGTNHGPVPKVAVYPYSGIVRLQLLLGSHQFVVSAFWGVSLSFWFSCLFNYLCTIRAGSIGVYPHSRDFLSDLVFLSTNVYLPYQGELHGVEACLDRHPVPWPACLPG